MQKASIEVIVGPMFAGKTSALISIAEKHDDDIVIFKPSFDTRYSLTDIKSHDGKIFHAVGVSCSDDMVVPSNVKKIIIDEIQFFNEPFFKGNILHTIMNFKRSGITVVCAGLDRNWQGKEFLISSKVISIADKITILKARCAVCNEPAAYTFKRSGSDTEIELGASDIYEPRCETHFYNFNKYAGDLRCIDMKNIFSSILLLESFAYNEPANENKHLTDA